MRFIICAVLIWASAVPASIAASAEEKTQTADTYAAEVESGRTDLFLRLNDKYFYMVVLGKDALEFEDISKQTKGVEGMLCIETDIAMTCHKLRKGQVGLFNVRYKGRVHPLKFRI